MRHRRAEASRWITPHRAIRTLLASVLVPAGVGGFSCGGTDPEMRRRYRRSLRKEEGRDALNEFPRLARALEP
jgi:hypothetical protein